MKFLEAKHTRSLSRESSAAILNIQLSARKKTEIKSDMDVFRRLSQNKHETERRRPERSLRPDSNMRSSRTCKVSPTKTVDKLNIILQSPLKFRLKLDPFPIPRQTSNVDIVDNIQATFGLKLPVINHSKNDSIFKKQDFFYNK